jgi:hypothetical protein
MDAVWGFQRLWVRNTSAKHEKARDESDHANGASATSTGRPPTQSDRSSLHVLLARRLR